jgi:Flp pilus assembly pilin Flp
MITRFLHRSTVKCQASVKALTRRFSKATDGVAAVEFALILPIMTTLLIGSIEMSEAITVDRRVSQVAATTGDLAARFNGGITPDDVTELSRIGSWLLEPYDVNSVRITIRLVTVECVSAPCVSGTQVPVNYAGQQVRWSCLYDPIASGNANSAANPGNANAESEGRRDAASNCACQNSQPFVAPRLGLLEFNTSPALVVSDVEYRYRPRFFNVFMERTNTGANGIYTLTERLYHKPRGALIKMNNNGVTTSGPNTCNLT